MTIDSHSLATPSTADASVTELKLCLPLAFTERWFRTAQKSSTKSGQCSQSSPTRSGKRCPLASSQTWTASASSTINDCINRLRVRTLENRFCDEKQTLPKPFFEKIQTESEKLFFEEKQTPAMCESDPMPVPDTIDKANSLSESTEHPSSRPPPSESCDGPLSNTHPLSELSPSESSDSDLKLRKLPLPGSIDCPLFKPSPLERSDFSSSKLLPASLQTDVVTVMKYDIDEREMFALLTVRLSPGIMVQHGRLEVILMDVKATGTVSSDLTDDRQERPDTSPHIPGTGADNSSSTASDVMYKVSAVGVKRKRGRPRKNWTDCIRKKISHFSGTTEVKDRGGQPAVERDGVGKNRYSLRGKKFPVSIFGVSDSEEERQDTVVLSNDSENLCKQTAPTFNNYSNFAAAQSNENYCIDTTQTSCADMTPTSCVDVLHTDMTQSRFIDMTEASCVDVTQTNCVDMTQTSCVDKLHTDMKQTMSVDLTQASCADMSLHTYSKDMYHSRVMMGMKDGRISDKPLHCTVSVPSTQTKTGTQTPAFPCQSTDCGSLVKLEVVSCTPSVQADFVRIFSSGDHSTPNTNNSVLSISHTSNPVLSTPHNNNPVFSTPNVIKIKHSTSNPEHATFHTSKTENSACLISNPENSAALTSKPEDFTSLTSKPKDFTTLTSKPDDFTSLTHKPENSASLTNTPEDFTSLTNRLEVCASLTREPEDSATLASKPEDSASLNSKPKDSVTLASKPEDSVTLASKPEDSVNLASKPEDSVTLSSKPEDSVTLASKPEDSVTLASKPEDSVTLASKRKPELPTPVLTPQLTGRGRRKRVRTFVMESDTPKFARRKRNNDKVAICKYCQRGFCDYTGVSMHARKFHAHEEDLGQYLLSMKPLERVKCGVCGVECEDRFRLQHHEDREHYRAGNFPCSHCGKTFNNTVALKAHVRAVHLTSGKPHTCNHCPATFKWAATLKQHVREIHRGVKAVTCDVCGKQFYRQSQLNRHSVVHAGEESKFQCSLCGRRFGYMNNLHRHVTIVHHRPQHSLFHCSFCGKGFPRKASLICHVEKAHFSMYPYHCAICNAHFPRSTALEKHMAKVHDDPDFKAPQGRRSHFKYHRTEEDMLCCSFCENQFFYKAQLVEHIHGTHGNTFPFHCHTCGQGFLEEDFVTVHRQQAHGSVDRESICIVKEEEGYSGLVNEESSSIIQGCSEQEDSTSVNIAVHHKQMRQTNQKSSRCITEEHGGLGSTPGNIKTHQKQTGANPSSFYIIHEQKGHCNSSVSVKSLNHRQITFNRDTPSDTANYNGLACPKSGHHKESVDAKQHRKLNLVPGAGENQKSLVIIQGAGMAGCSEAMEMAFLDDKGVITVKGKSVNSYSRMCLQQEEATLVIDGDSVNSYSGLIVPSMMTTANQHALVVVSAGSDSAAVTKEGGVMLVETDVVRENSYIIRVEDGDRSVQYVVHGTDVKP